MTETRCPRTYSLCYNPRAAGRCPSQQPSQAPAPDPFPSFTDSGPRSLLGDLGREDVNVAGTNILLVQSLLGTLSLFDALEHHQCVASGLVVGLVQDDVALGNTEVSEELPDFAHRSVERKAADLHG